MLMTHVAPLFRSPHGHLRAKAAWVSGVYADIKFAGGYGGGAHFQALFRAIVAALADTELPVRDQCLSGKHSVLQKPHFQALLRAIVAALAAALLVRRHCHERRSHLHAVPHQERRQVLLLAPAVDKVGNADTRASQHSNWRRHASIAKIPPSLVCDASWTTAEQEPQVRVEAVASCRACPGEDRGQAINVYHQLLSTAAYDRRCSEIWSWQRAPTSTRTERSARNTRSLSLYMTTVTCS